MKKNIILLRKSEHEGKNLLLIRFRYDFKLKEYVKAFAGVRWSPGLRSFYLPYSRRTADDLCQYLMEGNYNVDISALPECCGKSTAPSRKRQSSASKVPKLSSVNLSRFSEYRSYLKGLRLSINTVKVYANFIQRFLAYIGDMDPSDISKGHFRSFTEFIIEERKYGISSHRQLVSALNHFADLFVSESFEGSVVKRPRKSKRLPTVLSQEDVISLIRATTNLKHRATIALLYSSGLRIGECISLKLEDLDLHRKQIRIRMGKGRKDRYVVLAQSFMPLLQNYLTTYNPTTYFIESPGGKQYSPSSIRKFLERSCQRAGIVKKITPHTLRHSYATHLIENGVNLRHVQELLGHTKPETTMIYTHVAQKDLLRVRSPLDVAVERITQANKKARNVQISRYPNG